MTHYATVIVVTVLVCLLIGAALWIRHLAGINKKAREQAKERTRRAVTGSRSALVGKISEQIAPLIPGFGYNPRDVQWVGGAVDAVVWDGLEAGNSAVTVVFLEVKTGNARLTGSQKKIREAIQAGRIRFDTYTCPAPSPTGPATDTDIGIEILSTPMYPTPAAVQEAASPEHGLNR
jgi:hypothetical protein